MAKREIELSFTTSAETGFRDLEIVSVKRRCEHCGDWKNEAFDVCWDPDIRCKKDAPDASGSP